MTCMNAYSDGMNDDDIPHCATVDYRIASRLSAESGVLPKDVLHIRVGMHTMSQFEQKAGRRKRQSKMPSFEEDWLA